MFMEKRRAIAIAERIREAVHEARFAVEGKPVSLSVSIGGATFLQTSTFTELFKAADHWLYVAKNSGRNRVEVHPASGEGLALVVH